MPAKPPKTARPVVPVAFPELEQAMRVIVSVPKAEVDAEMKKERRRRQRKKSS